MSGERRGRSCQSSSSSATAPNASRPSDDRQRARIHSLDLLQSQDHRATNIANSTRPGVSNVAAGGRSATL